MELIDLTLVWAVIIAVGIMMYVLMDGFDLGVGILFPFAPGEDSRDKMMNSVAPVWDGNETWLILGGAGLLGAFPLVYSVFLPALYIGVFLMLAGLIFRGIAFEFRFKSSRRKQWWNAAFAIGSTVAAFAQGAVVGTYIQGFAVENMTYVGGPLDWLTPFTVLTGLGLVVGYALLGSTWTIMKTEGALQDWAYRLTPKLLLALMAVFAIVSVWTPLTDTYVRSRWFDSVSLIWLLPIATLFLAWRLWVAVQRRREYMPFLATMGIFGFTYLGLLASKWPYIVPPDHTLWDAASAPASQLFLLIGVLFLIPVVLAYTAWNYWVFRGKVSEEGGYH
ncbi:cytochrome d ubiquinol oxidase subunit II [Algiphilus sp.]|uniref:cytochrome d ubiquinol oxidase subunit II n=1 Tax=Algiphilus sp. TaxID=1872431 RepID=UPI001CA6F2E8|nr:cytochrome d ubiquinol oxidase subunit II [Algiphilus sp.]MBY8965893.1 cytochrome d ubiquinol oxidase subunit II [Algiphilus acroporae]MCI5062692.1 cytochrome d ubiquinol oxidase subunit II [Algiphilus sp.]MCI5104148.1 cytochrome d ubiquinol oxidase subunit II [Algiphilus sp.]MCR9091569.1 cytochrome d ubiquinol oxidase subunit II [Pseudomonadota bacterium]